MVNMRQIPIPKGMRTRKRVKKSAPIPALAANEYMAPIANLSANGDVAPLEQVETGRLMAPTEHVSVNDQMAPEKPLEAIRDLAPINILETREDLAPKAFVEVTSKMAPTTVLGSNACLAPDCREGPLKRKPENFETAIRMLVLQFLTFNGPAPISKIVKDLALDVEHVRKAVSSTAFTHDRERNTYAVFVPQEAVKRVWL